MSRDDNQEFVSRHGKRTVVDSQENIAATSLSPMPHASLSRKTKRSWQMRLPRMKLRISRRIAAVIGLIVLSVLFAGLISADSIKRDYERQAAAMKRSVFDMSKISLSSDTKASAAAQAMLAALKASATCRVTGIDVGSWYGPAKTAREQCQKTAKDYQNLRSSLATAESLSRYLESIYDSLRIPLALPTEGQFAIIYDYQTAWGDALKSLAGLQVPDVAKALHAQLQTHVQAVAGAWTKLVQANEARDGAGFTAAEADLQKAYGSLRALTIDLQSLLKTTQTSIDLSVDKLSR